MINHITWYLILILLGVNLVQLISFVKRKNYKKLNTFAESDKENVPINTMESTEDKERKEWKPDRGKYYVVDKEWNRNRIPQGGDNMADMLAVGSTGTGMSCNALLKLYGENDKSNVVIIDPKMEVEENITIQTDGKKQN